MAHCANQEWQDMGLGRLLQFALVSSFFADLIAFQSFHLTGGNDDENCDPLSLQRVSGIPWRAN